MESEPTAFEHDFFISHASEDKDAVARPLAIALRERGFNVWYDEFALRIGDRLHESIDRGLASSKRGIVVLSDAFFEKAWPQRELDGLAAREIAEEASLILPVWHRLSREEVTAYSPMLSMRVAGRTDEGIDELADRLGATLAPTEPANGASNPIEQLLRGASSGLQFTPLPDGVVTHRATGGDELVRVAASSYDMHLDVDDVPVEHRQTAADALQELQDIGDIFNGLGFGEKVEIEQRFDDLVRDLGDDGLHFWVGTYARELIGPDGRHLWPGAVVAVRADADASAAKVAQNEGPSEAEVPAAVPAGFDPDGNPMSRNQTCWCGSGKKFQNCHGK